MCAVAKRASCNSLHSTCCSTIPPETAVNFKEVACAERAAFNSTAHGHPPECDVLLYSRPCSTFSAPSIEVHAAYPIG